MKRRRILNDPKRFFVQRGMVRTFDDPEIGQCAVLADRERDTIFTRYLVVGIMVWKFSDLFELTVYILDIL